MMKKAVVTRRDSFHRLKPHSSRSVYRAAKRHALSKQRHFQQVVEGRYGRFG